MSVALALDGLKWKFAKPVADLPHGQGVTANPFAFLAQAAQMAWLPWLGCQNSGASRKTCPAAMLHVRATE
jgi:hypothetical protein